MHYEAVELEWRDPQHLFQASQEITEGHLRQTLQPTPNLSVPGISVEDYWRSVACLCPELRFVVRILLACSASEACVERIFSDEGNIHDKIHNRLDPAYSESQVKIKGNFLVERERKLREKDFGFEELEWEEE
mmetsp:Transcript_36441/g.57141  ORF Transcript_36441/g.57141 Transcript_36441/m.57141 type:complete len:133 (+) Transcript_36441:1589-1987(+)